MQSLKDLKVGQKCVIEKILTAGTIRRRFYDIGLIENTEIECVLQSPSGDPKAYLIRGAVIAIRDENCAEILIRSVENGNKP